MPDPPVACPWPGTAEVVDGRLRRIGGADLADLAARHGTPLYVVDEAELVARMRAYRQAFGPDVRIVYAAKALAVTAVLQIAVREGLDVDVASEGELATALRGGVAGERIVLHGNNKSAAELALALGADVNRIAVDNDAELDRLVPLAAGRPAPVDVWLRITPGVGAGGHAFIRTGQDDVKFGFHLSAGAADAATDRVVAEPTLRLRGLHCHIGSQVTDGRAYAAAVEGMVGLLARVRDRHGLVLDELNLGGGLGIVYAAGEVVPDVDAYAQDLRANVTAACARHELPVPRLVVEPGRSIVGPAGITLYTVGAVKDVPGVRAFAAVDGGMSDNLRPALYGAAYTFAAAGRGAPVTRTRPFAVVGKHCESGDVLGTDVSLPVDLGPGQLVAVAATGAYGHAMASNYNRLARPAMVLVRDGRGQVIVRRETVEDVLARDVPLARGGVR
ncbi:diaminopimelate decarboxylase [soil metagenome]